MDAAAMMIWFTRISLGACRSLAVSVAIVLGLSIACAAPSPTTTLPDRTSPTPVPDSTPSPNEVSEPSPSPIRTPTPFLANSVASAFYIAPDPLPPGDPGAIIASEEIAGLADMRLWTVLYRSVGIDGQPIAVSGMLAAATDMQPGPLKILAWGHGTTGLIDKSAPSRFGRFGDDIGIFRGAVEQGFIVAATDYEGLGTPGPHPYIVGISEGRSMLDAARAARSFFGSSDDDKVILVGPSQGGHATLFAAELSAGYAPDLQVVGALAFAPAGDLRLLAKSSTRGEASEDAHRSAISVLAAWHEIYGLPLNRLLTPAGLDKAAAVLDERAPSIDWAGDLFLENPDDDPDWRARLFENSPGHPASQDIPPILLMQGVDDALITVNSSRSVLESYCASGVTNVELRVIAGEDHNTILGNHLSDAEAWITERMFGEPASSSCDTYFRSPAP
jgi:alpha-beta hydrolase superfamily lysophospholipase